MASSTLSSEKRPHKGSLKNAGQCYAPDCWCNRVALTSNERLGVIKQTPRQASIDDIEWLCEEVERLRGEAEVADEQLAQLRGFAEAHKTCRGSDETCEQSRGVIYMPCERHKHGTFTMSVGYVPIPKAVCPMCETEQSTAQKASERRGTPEEEADWAEFGDCPRCWRCAAPVITIPGMAPGCIRNCPPSPESE